jgi:hypothetical protein
MNEGQIRTLVIALVTVAAGLALVVLAAIGGELATETSKRIEGAFVLLVPALIHSLTVMGREEARARRAELARGDVVLAEQRDGTWKRGVVINTADTRSGEVVLVDHEADDVREYPARDIVPTTEREPTGGHRV